MRAALGNVGKARGLFRFVITIHDRLFYQTVQCGLAQSTLGGSQPLPLPKIFLVFYNSVAMLFSQLTVA
jgi:hypothetical protein